MRKAIGVITLDEQGLRPDFDQILIIESLLKSLTGALAVDYIARPGTIKATAPGKPSPATGKSSNQP